MPTHLDYSKKTLSDRLDCVNDIIRTDKVRPSEKRRLKAMSDYILFSNDTRTVKNEKRLEYPIEGRNRSATIDKRQTSLDDIMESLENSPVSVYQLINSDRELFLGVRDTITMDDINQNAELRSLYDIIQRLSNQMASATGKDRYSLKKQIIETWQQMYLIRADNNPARVLSHALDMRKMELPEHVSFDEDRMPYSDCMVSFFNPTHVSFLLEYFKPVRQECEGDLNCDMYWLLLDFERLVRDTFRHDSRKMRLVLLKMLGYSNEEIDAEFGRWYGESHTKQYYSMMWRHTIPRDIVNNAQRKYVWWYWAQPRHGMSWKRCTKCGTWKPAHPLFFRKNGSAVDGLYSVCRDCSRRKTNAKG